MLLFCRRGKLQSTAFSGRSRWLFGKLLVVAAAAAVASL